MLAKVRSCAVVGLEGALVEVEVDLSNGLAGLSGSFASPLTCNDGDEGLSPFVSTCSPLEKNGRS